MTTKTYCILHRQNLGTDPCKAIEEYSQVGIKAICNKVDELPVADVYIRWGCTATLPGTPKVFNKASAIHRVFNKGVFRAGISGLAPMTYTSLTGFFESYEGGNRGPWIVRPLHHQRSEGMYLCKTVVEVVETAQSLPDFYISNVVDKVAEYRVFVCQRRVVWVLEKKPKDPTALSWGCVDQGSFKYVDWSDWPIPVLKNAISTMSHSGLDFGAVDVMLDKSGAAYCAEVNTAPWLSPYYQKRTALAFDHMVTGGDVPPVQMHKATTWKDFAHPTLDKKVTA